MIIFNIKNKIFNKFKIMIIIVLRILIEIIMIILEKIYTL
jgi:hypothetical protein